MIRRLNYIQKQLSWIQQMLSTLQTGLNFIFRKHFKKCKKFLDRLQIYGKKALAMPLMMQYQRLNQTRDI